MKNEEVMGYRTTANDDRWHYAIKKYFQSDFLIWISYQKELQNFKKENFSFVNFLICKL